MRNFITLILFLFSISIFAARPFATYYFEAVANRLVGTSASHSFTTDIKSENVDYYIFTKYEWSDTNGKNLPFSYILDGNSLGAGVRFWVLDHTAFIGTSYSKILSGKNKDENDLRIGGALYQSWEKDKNFDDLYAEVFYVKRANDTLGSYRWRDGTIILKSSDGKLWTYYLTQIWASVEGKNAAENRFETGAGIGYTFSKNRMSLNLDMRGGYIFSGNANKKLYFNPQILLAGSF